MGTWEVEKEDFLGALIHLSNLRQREFGFKLFETKEFDPGSD